MSKRILVIEDHEENRRLLRDLLTSFGYELIEAVTGEEGLTLAETQVPDLILMDIQLPGIDGYETTRRIKANPALRHIPIIAVTSYALSGDDVKAAGGRLRRLCYQALRSRRAVGQDPRVPDLKKNTKHEFRNPKQIRMFKKRQNSKQLQFGFSVLDFLRFGAYLASVCLGPRGRFRYSDSFGTSADITLISKQ